MITRLLTRVLYCTLYCYIVISIVRALSTANRFKCVDSVQRIGGVNKRALIRRLVAKRAADRKCAVTIAAGGRVCVCVCVLFSTAFTSPLQSHDNTLAGDQEVEIWRLTVTKE